MPRLKPRSRVEPGLPPAGPARPGGRPDSDGRRGVTCGRGAGPVRVMPPPAAADRPARVSTRTLRPSGSVRGRLSLSLRKSKPGVRAAAHALPGLIPEPGSVGTVGGPGQPDSEGPVVTDSDAGC